MYELTNVMHLSMYILCQDHFWPRPELGMLTQPDQASPMFSHEKQLSSLTNSITTRKHSLNGIHSYKNPVSVETKVQLNKVTAISPQSHAA